MIYDGNCRLGDLFTSRREKGRAGLPTLSVTLNDGLVNRDDLDRKQDTNLAPEEHLLVKPGDIAYNMMRMWQGAFGLADCEGLVSPAYVVLTPNARIDPLYASYLFKNKRMLHLFWAYSYGLTDDRLRLYFADLCEVPASILSLSEQKGVARILRTWDDAISCLDRLIDLSRRTQSQLLKELLSSHQSGKSSRSHWKCLRFGELFTVANVKAAQVEQSRYQSHGLVPVVDQGQELVAGYVDDEIGPVSPNAIVFGDHTRVIKWVDFPFRPGADGTQILRTKGDLLPKFGYHLLRSIDIPNLGYSRHMKTLKERHFSFPSCSADQKVITEILDAADHELANLKEQRRLLVVEKSGLMQQLLTGKRRVRLDEPAREIA